MKRIALAALCIWASPAFAADPAEVIPVEDPGFTWTGAYVGLHVGGGWGDKDWTFVRNENGPIPPPLPTTSHDVSGVIAGAQIGYNWQFGNIVAGAEAEISWSGIDGSSSCPNPDFVCSTEIGWMGTATARVGAVAMERLLVYAKGGVAFADEDFIGTSLITSFDNSTGSATRVGWTIGVGGEYAINENWSAKLEYMFADFGSEEVDSFFDVDGIFTDRADIEQKLHTVKFGINYHF